MIVVDTNTIAYLLVPGERSLQARKAFEKDTDWVAPRLWRSEFRNILALFLRQSLLSLEQALRLNQEAELLMRGSEYEVVSAQVLSLASASGCSAYDCEFVALAQDLRVRLVTSDRKLLNAFPANTISLDEFVS